MKPPRSLLDRTFRYVPARLTDVRKTFKRVREELRANQDRADKVVRSIATRKGK